MRDCTLDDLKAVALFTRPKGPKSNGIADRGIKCHNCGFVLNCGQDGTSREYDRDKWTVDDWQRHEQLVPIEMPTQTGTIRSLEG